MSMEGRRRESRRRWMVRWSEFFLKYWSFTLEGRPAGSSFRLARRVNFRILEVTMPLPPTRGMYDPSLERDACGLGFVADLRRPATHDVVEKGIEILRRLAHRGAAGCDPCT